ncbi:MAG: helix-turn-helix domain-containing protein [Anaerolineae bacterium]
MMSEAKPDPNHQPFKPEPEYTINDLETLKVLADPLRLQIVELCTQAPRTVKQVAAVLNVPPTKLYYHVKQLEERSLVKVVDTRIVSGIVEKQYQAAAYHYRVDRELFSLTSEAGKEGLNVMLTGLFDDTREDIQKSAEADVLDVSPNESEGKQLSRSLLISRNTLQLAPDVAEEFYRRLKELVQEYASAESNGSTEKQPYGLLVALYPSTGGTPTKHE